MDNAFAACSLFLLEGALCETKMCVFFEFLAFTAEFAVGAVVAFAVNINHVGDGVTFSFHTFMFRVRRLRLHTNKV